MLTHVLAPSCSYRSYYVNDYWMGMGEQLEDVVSETETSRVHWSFWVIGTVALVWNAMGVVNIFMQMNPDVLATYPESHRTIVASQTGWIAASVTIAIFGGTLGCVLLLLRKAGAIWLFYASLVAMIVVVAHTLSLKVELNASDIVLIIVMPVVVAALLAWYSKWTAIRGWID